MRRSWAPLHTSPAAALAAAPPQDDPDYEALATCSHGTSALSFASLGNVVGDQLVAAVERAARDGLAAERRNLGLELPCWRYTMVQVWPC